MSAPVNQPIDLDALRAAAFSDSEEDAVVTRDWLKRVHAELSAGRDAAERLGQVFAGVKL